MYSITKILSDKVSAAFVSCGYEGDFGCVTVSDRPDLCQFQCNSSFAAAKIYHKAPVMIAKDVAAKLNETGLFQSAEAINPGFLNLTLNEETLLSFINEMNEDSNTGIAKAETPLTILIDYGGPNVAKPLHIGHLRSAIIGESLKRLAKKMGHNAFGDIHLGDWGLQIGLIIAELAERFPNERCFSEDFDPEKDEAPVIALDLLNEVYPTASARSKTDEIFAASAHKATLDLQNGRPGYRALWKNIMKTSCADLKQNYDKLNVHFEYWLGESDSDAYIPDMIRILEDKKLLEESEGAMVVKVEEDTDKNPVPPCIIKKSDGSSLYATTDLATLLQRQKDFSPDEIWYVVDNRQALHFVQVFRTAKKAGIIPEGTVLEHYGFGTMNGSDGKPFKTRAGGVMRLSDLLGAVTDAALEKLRSSDYIRSLSEEEKQESARRVGVAAVKFGDLINQRSKDYIFDMDKFLSFEGKTGTYILYTVTRINSILRKMGISPDSEYSVKGIYSESEKNLYLTMAMTNEQFERAFSEKAPNYICDNAYRIASDFSSFYHDNRIIDEPDKDKRESWIALMILTRKVLLMHLDVLGIESVENM